MESEKITLDEYQKALSQLAQRRESLLFCNEGNDHARIVFSTIFRNAKSEVYIVAHDLTNSEVSNSTEYTNSLAAYLKQSNVSLNIMLSEVIEDRVRECDVFKLIFESNAYKEGNVNIYNLNGKKFKDNGQIVHFTFADGQMYRFETDIVNRKATGNFNDPMTVANLLENFNRAKELETTSSVSLRTIFS